jgi:cytidylate kinase
MPENTSAGPSSTRPSNRPPTVAVTVSALYGAGGSVIAPKLAERLGLPFFDRLIHARQSRDAVTIEESLTKAEKEQAAPTGILASLANLTSVLGLPLPGGDADPRGHLRHQVESSVAEVVSGAGGVILGRGAAVVLHDHPTTFHVRLRGSSDRCLAQGMAIESVTEDVARTHQADTDKAWARFVMRLFDKDPADPNLYHVVLDSTMLSFDTCIDVIETAATAFWSKSARM